MYRNCINCFTPLGKYSVCPRCGLNNAAYTPGQYHLPPETILHGRYLVGRAMGEGGFGITYAGYDPILKRKTAIKEFFPRAAVWRDPENSLDVTCYTSQNHREMFEIGRQKCIREAQSLAVFDDIPAIVRVLDFFTENNTAYIIMEFVEGLTLTEYVQRLPQKLTLPAMLELLRPVTQALDKVHARGFVHRDISPDNIMITHDGTAKLLDFGAVKAVSVGGSATENPVFKRGFSPLELYSTAGKIGPWTDVYSFAAVLVYLLTGSVPDEPGDRMTQDTVPQKLDGVCTPAQKAALLCALAVQPQQRQQSLGQLMRELTAETPAGNSGIPIVTPPPHNVRTDSGSPRSKRSSRIVLIAGALIFVLIAALIVVLIVGGKPQGSDTSPVGETAGVTAGETAAETSGQQPSLRANASRTGLIGTGWLHTVGLRADGTVAATVFTGDSRLDFGQCDVSDWTDIVAVDAGLWHTVGLKSDGTVLAAGETTYGRCKTSNWTDIVAVSASFAHTVGLRADGTVVATPFTGSREEYCGQCDVEDWTGIVAVAAGENHTVGLRKDGTVVATAYIGTNAENEDYGQSNVSDWTDVTAVSAGAFHTVALRKDGTVVAVGNNESGQCNTDDWTNVVAVSAGAFHTAALRADGTVVTTGSVKHGQCNTAGWTDIVAVAAGEYITVGLRADGTVVTTRYIEDEDDYNSDNDDAQFTYAGQCEVADWKNMMLPGSIGSDDR